MQKWNGSKITYDALGNMQNDPSIGASSLVFDERNHLFQALFGTYPILMALRFRLRRSWATTLLGS
jgi:hypothetical protein